MIEFVIRRELIKKGVTLDQHGIYLTVWMRMLLNEDKSWHSISSPCPSEIVSYLGRWWSRCAGQVGRRLPPWAWSRGRTLETSCWAQAPWSGGGPQCHGCTMLFDAWRGVQLIHRRPYLLALWNRDVTYSFGTQLGTFRQSRCRDRRSRYGISCPRQPIDRRLLFKMNRSHFKIWKATWHRSYQLTFPTGSPICTNFEFRSIAAKVWCCCRFWPSALLALSAASPAFSTFTVDCWSAALCAASSVDLLTEDAVIVLVPNSIIKFVQLTFDLVVKRT